MGEAMTRTQIALARKLRSRLLGKLSFLAVVGVMVGAFAPDAQAGFFDSLFGGGAQRAAPAYAYSNPSGDLAVRSERSNPSVEHSYSGGGKAFCVRLCDGRYYPIASSSSNSTPVQMCSAMCPAAKTKVFQGGEIGSAADATGARYTKLDQAFAYRKSVVPGCSCNGKDAFGLVTVDVATDPTLRSGDIVATRDGLKAVQGSRKSIEFAPAPASKVTGALRDRLDPESILCIHTISACGYRFQARERSLSSGRPKAGPVGSRLGMTSIPHRSPS
jgi:hypothetical protein